MVIIDKDYQERSKKSIKLMIFYQKLAKFTIFLALFALTLGQAYAKSPEIEEKLDLSIRKNQHNLIKQYKDWGIYKFTRNGKKYCYAISRPISTKANILKRAKPYFLVNDLIDDADEVMNVSGFFFKDNTDIEISFGSRKFYLFAYKARGWAYTKNDDLDIIKEMQKNADFTITSFSKDNRIAKDRYSLIGFRQAYFKLKDICKNG